jgi:hypothetical protein
MKRNETLVATAASLLLVSAFASQAMAANKPIKGKYKCTGTARQTVYVGNIDGGSVSAGMKAKMNASRGRFLLYSIGSSWPTLIEGSFDPNLQQLGLSSVNKTHKMMLAKNCSVTSIQQSGTGSQNKNGTKISFSIEQSYSCGAGTSRRVDQYDLTCKR